ncbi:MAG: hypothetical protein JHD16_16260 [Solirubrobacteraceae bacterium]|nr:hypothetical protein [Solirubrobacteraceae bacterium]
MKPFHRPSAGRALLAAALGASALMSAAPIASAGDLRSPRLESSCETDFSYSEVRVGPFIVEGCNKAGNARDGESARWLFKGDVEVNGMLVEPSSGDDALIAATRNGQDRNGRMVTDGTLDRNQSTRLVVDPRIAGQRRRIVINNGPLHLEGSGTTFAGRGEFVSVTGATVDGSAIFSAERASAIPGGGVIAKEAGLPAQRFDIGNGTGTTDLPIGGVPALLGLRLFDIEDVQLGTDGMTFDAELKLGSGAPGLMRDVLGRATIELNDGEGMQISDLRFRIGHIGIPGVGGMDNLRVNYDGGRDEWSGGFDLDLGDLFPGMDFSATVNASTGIPSAMNLEVQPLNIAVGPGIFLQGLRGGFDTSPLSFTAGADITAGPQIAGWSVLTASGDSTIALEPNFRFEAEGRVRVFPTGPSSEIANGSVNFVYDSTGLISLRGDARYEATAAGFGISAQIGGSGSFSTSSKQFNIGASATGNLELGFLGSVRIVELRAVVSSDGFGTCGEVLSLISAGIGQNWRNGGLQLLSGCDLGPFRVNVAGGSRAERLQNGAGRSRQVIVRGENLKKALIEVRGPVGGVPIRLVGPDGSVVSTIGPGDRKSDGKVSAINSAVGYTSPPQPAGGESSGKRQHLPIAMFALKDPKPGRYLIQTPAGATPPSEVALAVDAAPLRVQVRTERTGKSGERRLRTRARGLEAGDLLQFGFRTATGVEPIGEPVGASGELTFLEQTRPGRRQIVAQVVRNGVPVPGRVTVVGAHTAELPGINGDVRQRRQGNKLQIQARVKPGSDRPEGFEYRVTQNGQTGVHQRPLGKSLKVWLPDAEAQARVEIHPIFRGAAIERTKKVVRIP